MGRTRLIHRPLLAQIRTKIPLDLVFWQPGYITKEERRGEVTNQFVFSADQL